MAAVAQPSGTVTLVFTDIEGSTRLLEELGVDAYRNALAEHRRVVREACARHDGYEVDYEGDAFFYAFASAQAAVSAVSEAMVGLDGGPIRIRVGIHTGEPALDPPKYVGMDVHRAARIMSSAHGGQVVLSPSTVALLDPGAFALEHLGEHRLKDLTAPIPLHQLGLDGLAGEFPPLKTLYRTNLPVPATPFLGREDELAIVAERLLDPDTRLLTLTGPGGTGKTRLALQAAAEAADRFPDGVFWVALAPLRDPGLVPATAAQALEVQEQPGVSIADSIAHAFASRRSLVVVDNCEHLVDAVARLLQTLLERCSGLVACASSRERLGLRTERLYDVPSMTVTDGAKLFLERARANASDFEPDRHVAAICEAVDGLPLAIELAAARVRALSTQAIRERLGERLSLLTSRDRDVDARQRTLEATVAWSYDLLDAEEQHALCALSVFAGGCKLEAAEAVAGADLDVVERLLDKSLLRRRIDNGHDRYWMLETIREYASDQLETSLEAAFRARHSVFYLEFAERCGLRGAFELHGSELDGEHSNLLVALGTLRDAGETADQLRLARALARFWYRGGHLREGLAYLEEALRHAGDVSATVACDAYSFASYIATDLGDAARAETHARAELALARDSGGAEELVDAFISVGCAAELREDLEDARRFFEDAADGAREARYAAGLMVAHAHLADLALYEGDFERAVPLLEDSVQRTRELGWKAGESAGLINLARAHVLQRRTSAAAAALREAIPLVEALPMHLASWLRCAAAVAGTRGDDRTAATLIGADVAIRDAAGGAVDFYERDSHDALVTRLQDTLGGEYEVRWEYGIALTAPEMVAVARSALD
ncbi:MAG: NB-ARC domain-containing protein [Gaiella sp.]|nr:NB-ARC domain-containing protein [Gaiella sp.]